jgi:dihydrofolate reductase
MDQSADGRSSEVVWHVTMSLDGFIAGPDHAMEWAFEHGAPSRIADEVRTTTGVILGGRGWYDAATSRYDGVDGIYGGAWTGPVFVLTHRPPPQPGPSRVTFLEGDITDAVTVARGAANGRNLEIFGAGTARQCLDAGLIDEIVIHLAPLLLGDGVRLYGGPGGGRVDLERSDLEPSGPVTDLRFRVRRAPAEE